MKAMVSINKKKAWSIEITEGMRTIFKTTVPMNHISSNSLENLLKTYIQKYALSDDEILELHCRKNTKLGKKSIHYIFFNSSWNTKKNYISATYVAKSSNICAEATIIELE